MKDLMLKILHRTWTVFLPSLLPITFMVGVFFNLWKIQGWNPILSGVLCGIGAVGLVIGLLKLIKVIP